MMINQYVKKPIIVKAIKWTGLNKDEITQFCSIGAGNKKCFFTDDYLWIKTVQGEKKSFVGDWIIFGAEGEYYPLSQNIFEKYYATNEMYNIQIGNEFYSFIAPIKIRSSKLYSFVIEDAKGTEFYFNQDLSYDGFLTKIEADKNSKLNDWHNEERNF